MTTPAGPVLSIEGVVVRAVVGGDAPATPHARDLPDLARFLFDALGARNEREEKILDGVSLEVPERGAVAVVGEVGSGKSTLARVCARLVRPDEGKVTLRGVDIHKRARSVDVRRGVQVLLDDLESGLDPRRTVRESLVDALSALRIPLDAASGGDGDLARALDRTLARALERARLDASVLLERAGALDEGRRRLVAIARALLADPAVLVVDEPATHLDPSARALVLDALAEAPTAGTALLVLTRDLAAARALSTSTVVLLKGAVVEAGETAKVLAAPNHPYAQALVAAAPRVAY
jgi:peptide/nickel transport system ATP-binding protein